MQCFLTDIMLYIYRDEFHPLFAISIYVCDVLCICIIFIVRELLIRF